MFKISNVMRKPGNAICEQQRRRSACASAQSDQHLCCSLPRQYNTSSFYIQNFRPPTSFYRWAGQLEDNWIRKTGLEASLPRHKGQGQHLFIIDAYDLASQSTKYLKIVTSAVYQLTLNLFASADARLDTEIKGSWTPLSCTATGKAKK